MKPLVGPYIQTLKPYVPGKPIETLKRERGIEGEVAKLASNENPLGTSPLAVEAARAALSEGHLYPDGAAFDLRKRLASHLDVSIDRIVTANGSNELIELIVRTFTRPGDHAVVSEHSFIVYRIVMQSMNVSFEVAPARDPMTHDLRAMAEAVTDKTKLVFIANPNNPTGTHNSEDELRAMLDKLAAMPDPPLVVMDEAYYEYADANDYPDSIEFSAVYPRLLSLRTFSKCYGMAAFRVGDAVCSPEIAGYLHTVRAPFNVSRISQKAAIAALDDTDFLAETVKMNKSERERVAEALRPLMKKILPSQTNFLLCETPCPGAVLYDRLLDRGIIIRPLAGYQLPNHVRISIGLPHQNDRLIEAVAEVLS